MSKPDALSIAFSIADESRDIVKLLAIGYRTDGSIFTSDTDLTIDEIRDLCSHFISRLDHCLGGEMERSPDG